VSARAFLALAAVLAAAAFVWSACGDRESSAQSKAQSGEFTLAKPADDAWKGPALPEFELVERSERKVKLSDLRGAPFVFDFVFTTCTGPCPAMTRNMAQLQAELQGELKGSEIELVSFSVDPPTDTPEVLRRYADQFGADAKRWLFLTGDEAQVSKIAQTILLPMARAPASEAAVGMQVAHTTRFIVADASGVVRGMYDGTSAEGIRAAAARARWLAEHPGR
jgi:protein SCO1/2